MPLPTRRNPVCPDNKVAWPRDETSTTTATALHSDRTGPATVATTESINTTVEWGPYEQAIRRWEQTLARPAPHPVEPGRGNRPRLATRFVEWLMGLPDGWVTDPNLGLPRTAQLRILGNGVVPQQATHALRHLLGGPLSPADKDYNVEAA